MDYSDIYTTLNTIGRVFVCCAPANCDPVFKRTSGSNDTRYYRNENVFDGFFTVSGNMQIDG